MSVKMEVNQEKLGQRLEEDVLLRQKLAQNTRDISDLMAKYETHRTILAGIINKVDSLPDMGKFNKIEETVDKTGNTNKQLEFQIKEVKDELRTLKTTMEEKDVSNRNWTGCIELDVKEKVTFLDARIEKTIKSLGQLKSEWSQWKANNFTCTEVSQILASESQKENISPGNYKEFPFLQQNTKENHSPLLNKSKSQSTNSKTITHLPKEFIPKASTKISSIAESLVSNTKDKSIPSSDTINPPLPKEFIPKANTSCVTEIQKDTKDKSIPTFDTIKPQLPKEFVPRVSTKISSIAESLVSNTKVKSIQSFDTLKSKLPKEFVPKANALCVTEIQRDTKGKVKSIQYNTIEPQLSKEFVPKNSTKMSFSMESPVRYTRDNSIPSLFEDSDSPPNSTNLKPSAPEFVPGLSSVKVQEKPSDRIRRKSMTNIPTVSQPVHYTSPSMMNMMHILPTSRTFVPMTNISANSASTHAQSLPQMYGIPVPVTTGGSVSMPILQAPNNLVNSQPQPFYIPANNGWFSVSDMQG